MLEGFGDETRTRRFAPSGRVLRHDAGVGSHSGSEASSPFAISARSPARSSASRQPVSSNAVIRDAAAAGLKAVDAKDADALYKVIETIDVACESCHLQFWYPNDERAKAAARKQGIID